VSATAPAVPETPRGAAPSAWGEPRDGPIGAVLERLPAAACVLLIAVAVWALYGLGYVWYDALYSLIWGKDLAHLHVPPDFDALPSPTPHPLANAAGALLAPFGIHALAALKALTILFFAAVGWAAFRLGERLFAPAVGVSLALVLLTRSLLVERELMAAVDIPYVALVLWAAAVEARRPRRGAAVLLLLGLAGLLRPEAWPLAGVYALYLMPGRTRAQRVQVAALAAAAPLCWFAFDLIAPPHDPLHSLHVTQEGAVRLERHRSFQDALLQGPRYLIKILHAPIAAGGLAGGALALLRFPRRAALPVAIFVIGGLSFMVLGVAGLSLLPRYFFVPAAMLALFCGVALFGWNALPRDDRLRLPWMGGALLLAAAIAAWIPKDVDHVQSVQATIRPLKRGETDLRRLTSSPRALASFRRCASEPVRVNRPLLIPELAFMLKRRPAPIKARHFNDARRGLVVTAPSRSQPIPPGFRTVYRNRSWALSERC
jgi:hypothetical protein